jgi:hypothetical protein
MNERSRHGGEQGQISPRRSMGPGGGPMRSFEKPKNARKTALRLLGYLGDQKLKLAIVVVTMLVSSASMLAGTYFIKPLINQYILPGDWQAFTWLEWPVSTGRVV